MTEITTCQISRIEEYRGEKVLVLDVTVKSAKKNARDLAPEWSWVRGYFDGKVSKEEYTSLYQKKIRQARKENPQRWENTLRKFDRIVFACYCKAGDFCHRIILAAEFKAVADELGIPATVIPEGSPPPPPKRNKPKTFEGMITSLDKNEVFVFGSNESGFHGAGSAGLAMRNDARNTWRTDDKFQLAMKAPVGHADRIGHWAIFGVGRGHQVGLNGESYAIATVTKAGAKRSRTLSEIREQLEELFSWACENQDKIIYCAINGGGLNGYTKEEIASAYPTHVPNNVLIPEDIYDYSYEPKTGDGVDHINIYSKGKTELGRWMSNFARAPIFVDGIEFASIEAYWYWLGVDASAAEKMRLTRAVGFEAKQLGRELREKFGSCEVPNFEEKILSAIREKVHRYTSFAKQLKESSLPFRHYYVFKNGFEKDAGFEWIVEFWEDLRCELRGEVPPRRLYHGHEGSQVLDEARYAGVGSRETPERIIRLMQEYASLLAEKGMILRSGAAKGADTAFEIGCDAAQGQKEIFKSQDAADWAKELIQNYLPPGRAWRKFKPYVQGLLARNMMQMLGFNGDTPVEFVLCWTPDGEDSGGTGYLIRAAEDHGITVYNLRNVSEHLAFRKNILGL